MPRADGSGLSFNQPITPMEAAGQAKENYESRCAGIPDS